MSEIQHAASRLIYKRSDRAIKRAESRARNKKPTAAQMVRRYKIAKAKEAQNTFPS